MPHRDVTTLVEKLKTQKGIVIEQKIVPGANHFFDGKVEPLMQCISQYLDKRLKGDRRNSAASRPPRTLAIGAPRPFNRSNRRPGTNGTEGLATSPRTGLDVIKNRSGTVKKIAIAAIMIALLPASARRNSKRVRRRRGAIVKRSVTPKSIKPIGKRSSSTSSHRPNRDSPRWVIASAIRRKCSKNLVATSS